jgi:GDP-4-dehydro-6-deoxy-D-mannose reductase
MRLLVTGADGFVGQHVLDALLRAGHHVAGAITGTAPDLTTLSADDARRVDWVTFDLRDAAATRRTVLDLAPDAVLHLAAASSVSRSWKDPDTAFQVNATGALHLLTAIRQLPSPDGPPRAVVLVGSGEAYGRPGTEADPLQESSPLRPSSPYGASKAAQEMLGWALGRSPDTRLVLTRSFTQTGPGQTPTFVTIDWATQLLSIRRGHREPVLEVGNVDVVRDFLDVRDAAGAYVALLESPEASGAFNVCSGRGVSLHDLLDALQRAVGVEVEVRPDPERLRPADIPSMVGDPGRLREATGWTPRYGLDETLADVVRFLEVADDP